MTNSPETIYSLKREFEARCAAKTLFHLQHHHTPKSEADHRLMRQMKDAASAAYDVFHSQYGAGPDEKSDDELKWYLMLTLNLLNAWQAHERQ
jgi:hypothetical protein